MALRIVRNDNQFRVEGQGLSLDFDSPPVFGGGSDNVSG